MVGIDKIKEFFKDDRFCAENGVTILEVNEEYSKIGVEIEGKHLNASNTVQGGLIFTLADFAFAVHANSNGKMTVSQNATISFLRPASCKYLTAMAKPINAGRTTCLYEVDVTDERGKRVAFVTVTGYILGDNPKLKND